MAAQVVAAAGEDRVQRAAGADVQRHEHAGVLAGRGTSSAVAASRIQQHGAERGGDGGAVRAAARSTRSSNMHLALQRAVDRALGRDHAQLLDLLLGQVVGHAHDEREAGGAAAVGRGVLDVDLQAVRCPSPCARRTSPS